MRRTLPLLLAVLSLGLGACKPDAWSASSNTTGTAQSSSGSGTAGNSGNAELLVFPEVKTIFEVPAEVLWNYTSHDPSAPQIYQERVWSDGAGGMAMHLEGYAEGSGNTPTAPSSEVRVPHEGRQLFLARHRGPQLRDHDRLTRNYTWEVEENALQIDGIDCDRIQLQSVYGIGDATLLVSHQDRLLLGWVLFDRSGTPMQTLQAVSVDLSPDLNGVSWATAPVSVQDYTGSSDDLVLGFTPLDLQYFGPGFETQSLQILLASQASSELNNFHLRALTDGLRIVFVAQRFATGGAKVLGHVSSVRFARVGGVNLVEGRVEDVWIVAAGPLHQDDLTVILASHQ